jgi:hypothetical protein
MEKLTKPSPTSVLRSSDARDYCCRGNSLGGRLWWALVDDFRTLPLGQIVAGIPHIGELSLL